MLADTFTPQFYRHLQHLKIKTRRSFLGSRQGNHLSLKRGHGLEFADYRPYAPGDDYRHIDWGVYGRSERLYIRQFREEQDLHVMFLIDASASMGGPEEEQKFQRALQLALALGYVALTDGDTVTYTLLGQRTTPRYVGPRSIRQAAKELSEVHPQGSFDLPKEIMAAATRHKVPGKCFFVSDCLYPMDEIAAAMDGLRARSFDTGIIHVLSPSELTLNLPEGNIAAVDSETGEALELELDQRSARDYAQALADHIEALERYCKKHGISYALISSGDNIEDIVLERVVELGLAG